MIDLSWAERVGRYDDEGLDDEMRKRRDRLFYDSAHLRRLRDRRAFRRGMKKQKKPTASSWPPRPPLPHRARWRALARVAKQWHQRHPQPLQGYFCMPRSAWGEGPWQNEPDLIVWTSPGKLRCVMRRSPSGNWNGYVAVPKGHPAWGLHYDVVEASGHGGLTYGQANWAFHTPGTGARRAWWFGFDCGHYMDSSPALEALTGSMGHPLRMGVYRDAEAVRLMTEELAEELDQLARKREVTP